LLSHGIALGQEGPSVDDGERTGHLARPLRPERV
jgi:hypothetical protein